MKILQVNSIVNSGSTGRIAEDIGQVAISRGYQSFIAYGRGPSKSKSSLVRIGSSVDLINHGLKSVLFDLHGLGSVQATKELIKRFISINPDAIYLHNLHGYYINYPILFDYLSELDKPIFWTLFDCWAFTGHCTYFDDINCNKWKSQCVNCPKSNKYPISIFLDNSLNNYNRKRSYFTSVKRLELIVNSAWLKNIVQSSFLSNLPLHHIPTGVDLAIFKVLDSYSVKTKYNIQHKRIILGVASTWDKRKGLNDFIELSKILPSDMVIVLVGLSSSQKRNLPVNIIGISRTENLQELVEFYNAADVFVNPTYQDNFPTTNIESLACGTPVITYQTGGSPEAIDLTTGFVVEKGRVDLLFEAILKVVTEIKIEWRSNCRIRAEKLFNKYDRFEDYLNLIY